MAPLPAHVPIPPRTPPWLAVVLLAAAPAAAWLVEGTGARVGAVAALVVTALALAAASRSRAIGFLAHACEQLEEALAAAQEGERRYRQIFATNTAIKLLVDPATGTIVDANPAAAAFYGYSLDELRNKRIVEINVLAAERVREAMQAAREGLDEPLRFRHRLASGEIRDVEVHSGPVPAAGRELLLSIITDVTPRLRAEAALRASEARYRGLFQNIPIGIYRTRPDGSVLDANAAMAELLGFESVEELCHASAWDFYWELTDRQLMLAALESKGAVRGRESRFRRKDGAQLWVRQSARLLREAGETVIEGTVEDVTLGHELAERLERLNEELREQSVRDGLTGLYNRRFLDEALEREVRRAVRKGTHLAVLIADIDLFKIFNDTHGHRAGDAVLRAVGSVLRNAVRAEDVAARYGGEEFMLLLPETSMEAARERADQIRLQVEQLEVTDARGCLPPVRCSIGVAVLPDHAESGSALVEAADTALYEAKRTGRNRVVVAPPRLAA